MQGAAADGNGVKPASEKPQPRVAETLSAAARKLQARTDSPKLESEVLLAHVLGVDRAALLARPEQTIPVAALARFEALSARRAGGEPLAYLTGTREFWSLELEVNSDVLIPRPETERLVEAALERVAPGSACRILDLGTGSGAIALAVGSERPHSTNSATDASRRALSVAKRNLARTAAKNVRLLACDWFEAFRAPAFDLILANPPYVADTDPYLTRGDLPHEPRQALTAGPDGLAAIRVIVAGARARLKPRGMLLLEHGFEQGAAVRALMKAAGFGRIFTLEDYAGLDRVSGGQG